MIIKPVLKRLCNAWLGPRIILREERYFSNPELIPLALDDPDPDFIFGLTGNSVPAKPAAPDMVLPARSINSAAVRLNQRGKRFLNAVVPATKSSLPRQALLVVTSLDLPSPEIVYRDLSCARGQDEN